MESFSFLKLPELALINILQFLTFEEIVNLDKNSVKYILKLEDSEKYMYLQKFLHDKRCQRLINHPANNIRCDVWYKRFYKRVRNMIITPDGEEIISYNKNPVIYRWDRWTGKQLGNPLIGHTELITCMILTPEGDEIISGSYDNTIRRWDRLSGKQIGESFKNGSFANSLCVTSDGQEIISSHDCMIIKRCNRWTGELIDDPIDLFPTLFRCYSCTITPDDREIICGGTTSIDRYNRITGKRCIKELMRLPEIDVLDNVETLIVPSDGNEIISGNYSGLIVRWDKFTGEVIKFFLDGRTEFWCRKILLGPNKSIISVNGCKINIFSYNFELLFQHESSEIISSIALTPDNREIIYGLVNGEIRSCPLKNVFRN